MDSKMIATDAAPPAKTEADLKSEFVIGEHVSRHFKASVPCAESAAGVEIPRGDLAPTH